MEQIQENKLKNSQEMLDNELQLQKTFEEID